MVGIYKITNTENGNFYIGSSIKCKERIRLHFNKLKNNKHKNAHLQRAVNIYGLHCFEVEILEVIVFSVINTERLLEIIESDYIDRLNPQYNNTKCTSRPGSIKMKENKKAKTEKEIQEGKKRFKEKMAIATKNYYNSLSDEQKAERNKHKLNRVFSEQTRLKLKEKAKSRVWSEDVKKKISESMKKNKNN